MNLKHHVFLDPDGTLGRNWLFVVVEGATGVVYHTQCGGTANRQAELEGYLVPLSAPEVLTELRRLFERSLLGAGAANHVWPANHVRLLRDAVGEIPFWTSDGSTDKRGFLKFAADRLSEADEAWLPVYTGDGKGFLLWSNSD